MKITVWRRLTKSGYQHNHIEEGHVENNKPIGQPHQTRSWKDGEWEKEWMWLNDNNEVTAL